MSDRKLKVSALSAGIAAALGAGYGGPALAQQGEAIEEIVVTGSYIRRSSFDSPNPVQILDQEAMARVGATQMVDVLKELTVNSGSQFYNETNNRAGTSQFNIRNLGLGSTLALLNGRRAGIAPVADDTGTDYLDINQFPVSMIERVEVLTDGASALYGSQAVAGVANIITRKGFEGFEVSAGYHDSEIEQKELNFAAGSSFADGQGSFNLYGAWYEQGDAYRSDFDWLNHRLNPSPETSRFLSSTGSPGVYRQAVVAADGTVRDRKDTVMITNPDYDPMAMEGTEESMQMIAEEVGAAHLRDQDCVAAGGVLRSDRDSTCRYLFVDQVSVISAEERAQLFSEFEWEFSDTLSYYAEASYSNNTVRRASGGSTFNTGQAMGGGFHIPADHPFNFFVEGDPASTKMVEREDDDGNVVMDENGDPIMDTVVDRGSTITYIRPEDWDPSIHTAVDLRATARPLGREVNKTDLTQFIEREIAYTRFMNGIVYDLNDNWQLDLSYGWAKSTRTTNAPHNYRSDIFQQLVRDGDWNPFGTRLSDPDLVSPKDPTKTAGNSELVLSQFDTPSASNAEVIEQVTDAVFTGDLFELGNGNVVQAAFGGQFRDVTIKIIGDSLSDAGESNEESISGPVRGSQDVWALFTEFAVPVTDQWDVQIAARLEDYGELDTLDPKVAFQYRPSEFDWLSFRGSWGTSFQAPTVRQRASATSSAFIDDPASPGTGPNAAVCVNTGLNNNIVVAVEGSPDLMPQEAENFNFGAVFRFDNGLDASVDYFKFDYTDLIAQSEGAQAIVNNDCMDDGIPNDPRVIRDAGGQLRQVNTQFVNIGSVETEGFDASARYSFDYGPGTFFLDAAATYVRSFDVDVGDGETFDGAGSRNFNNNFSTLPKLRYHMGGTYIWSNQSLTGTYRYVDEYTNDQSNNGVVDSWETFDVQYTYTASELIGDGETEFTFGVNNLTDEDPPRLTRLNAAGEQLPALRPNSGGFISDGRSDRPGYDDRAGHDLRGRVLYIKAKHTF